MDELTRETAAVLRALRERDENTFAHCDRTCALSVEIGRAFGLSAQALAVLRWAAELHDIGKIGIPDRVLFKPGRLDDEELGVMRTHPRRGHDILASIPDVQIASIATVVLHHHEAVDGSGYPEGLRGEGIPVLARILSIVDSYDAIATVRPYHAPSATWRSCEYSTRSRGESTTRTFCRPSARLLSSVRTGLPASTTPR